MIGWTLIALPAALLNPVVAHHHALAQSGVAAMGVGQGFMVSAPVAHRLGREGAVMMAQVSTVRHSRRPRRRATVMAMAPVMSRRRGGGGGVMTSVMMDQGLGGRSGQGEQDPDKSHGQRGPDDGGHDAFP
jgi:hypothetical protein